jgi:hypothetical protein
MKLVNIIQNKRRKTMKNFQKMGGIAALVITAAFVVGLVLNFTFLDSSGIVDPVQKVAFLVDTQTIQYIWILFIYVIFGIFAVVLALALYDRLKTGSPAIAQTATVFGIIWAGLCIASGLVFNIGMGTVVDLYGKDPAQAATVWLALDPVAQGVGCAIEIPGGLWVLLISWAALRAGVFPRALNYWGMAHAVAGLLTVVPPLYNVIVMVWALGQIVWYVWLGIVLLRGRTSAAA